jgi:toxin ParE1/3/4
MPRSPPRAPKKPAPSAEPHVTVRQAALDDLEAIGLYTLERWGERQLIDYLTTLHGTFQALAKNPKLGTAADDVRKGYWRHHVGSHMVYFRRKRSGVEIVRVLHERMSPRRHL